MSSKVLVLNSGSSSLKFKLFEKATSELRALVGKHLFALAAAFCLSVRLAQLKLPCANLDRLLRNMQGEP